MSIVCVSQCQAVGIWIDGGSTDHPAPQCLIPIAGPTFGVGIEEQLSWYIMDKSEFSALEEDCSSGARQ